jgi:hypothetical protein
VGLISHQKNFSPTTILAGGVDHHLHAHEPHRRRQTGGTFLDALINMTVAARAPWALHGRHARVVRGRGDGLNFTGITIPAGSCTITVPITSSTVGALPNATNGVTTVALPQGPGSNTDILNVCKPTIAGLLAEPRCPRRGIDPHAHPANPGPIALTGTNFTDVYPRPRERDAAPVNGVHGRDARPAGGNTPT